MNARHYNSEKLKRVREERSLTQELVAKKLDVNRQTIYRAEKGLASSYELLCDMSAVYDIDVTSLLYPRPLPDVKSGEAVA